MIKHSEIIQGTEEWHKIKWGKVGGSSADGLMIESETLMIDILSQRLEEFQLEEFQLEESYVSPEMERGIELEPEARKRLIEYTGIDFIDCGWLQDEKIKLLGISPDGITSDSKFACEIKCPARKKHTQTIRSKEIPKDNLNQCLHYFVVNLRLESLFFMSFRPESKHPIFVKEIKRSDFMTFGTKAKPITKTVEEWVMNIRASASVLEEKINQEIEKLNF